MTALFGLQVRLERTVDIPCAECGETAVVIGSSAGPHALRCICCDRHRGRLQAVVADFLAATVDQFGRPTLPITIRNSQFAASSSAAATETSTAL
jgi:hypothetical protein